MLNLYFIMYEYKFFGIYWYYFVILIFAIIIGKYFYDKWRDRDMYK